MGLLYKMTEIFYITDKKSFNGRRYRNAYIKAICLQCGKEFNRKVANIKLNRCECCSISCANRYNNAKQRLHEAEHAKRICPEGTQAGKRKAINAVRDAVKWGIIIREEVCSSCGGGDNIEAHHGDYSKPLTIIWLCQSCHQKLHHGHDIKGKVVSYRIL